MKKYENNFRKWLLIKKKIIFLHPKIKYKAIKCLLFNN